MNTNSPVIPIINNPNSLQVQTQLNIPFSYSDNEETGVLFGNGHVAKMTSKVKLSDLMVDFSYQRHPVNKKIDKIVKNFDLDLLGVIICSMREDGSVAVIDGSHRYHALIKMNLQDAYVNALVYFGLSIKDEAKIFAISNQEHTKPTTADIFKAGIVAGDKITIEINNIMRQNNIIIGVGPGDNKIRALSTVKRIYVNAGGDVLDKTIKTIKAAYGNNSNVMRDQLLSAVAVIFYRYKNIDEKRMILALQKFGNPVSLIANAQAMVSSHNKQITFTTLPYLIVEKYNSKLKTNRLPDFPMNLLPQQVWANNK